MSANIPLFPRNEYLQGPVSLWDARNTFHDNGREYYTVEIYSDENCVEKEQDIDKILNMNSYKCHICNIDVPKSYLREHTESAKHETCMKIANIALERTQLHMKSDLIPPRQTIEVTDTYFCDHCSVVVQNIDKDKHKSTNKHLNSVKNYSMLLKLVTVYEDPDNVVGDIPSVEEIELHQFINDLALSEVRVKYDSSSDILNSVKQDADKDKDKQTSKDPKGDIKINSDVSDDKLNQQSPQVKNSIDKRIIKVNQNDKKTKKTKKKKQYKTTPKIPKIEVKHDIQENNEIKAEKKSQRDQLDAEESATATTSTVDLKNDILEKKTVKENNQIENQVPATSSTSTVEEASEQDTLINAYSENLSDLKHYIEIASFLYLRTVNVTAWSEDTVEMSGPGVEKVRIPLLNLHGYSVKGQDIACKICLDINSIDGRKHKWSDVHMKKLMLPLMKGYFRQVSDKLNHCVLCNSIHSTAQQPYHMAEHNSSAEHANNVQRYTVVKKISKKVAHLVVTNSMRSTYDRVHCKICEIHLAKTNDNINKHVHSAEHIKNHDSILLANKISKVPFERGCYICLVCQKKIWPGHLLAHCGYYQHKKKLVS